VSARNLAVYAACLTLIAALPATADMVQDASNATPTALNTIAGKGGQSSGLGVAASPTFTGLSLSGLTPASVPFVGPGGLVSQDNAGVAAPNGTGFFYDSANQTLKVLQTPLDYVASYGQMAGIFSTKSSGGARTALMGWSLNDAPPGTYSLPEGVLGHAEIAVGSQGNQSFGVYGETVLKATAGTAIGAEFTTWNQSGQVGDTSIPSHQSIGTTYSVANGLQVTCGTATGMKDCSYGVLVGSNGGLSGNQFAYGLWVAKANIYDVMVGSPGDNAGNMAFAGSTSGFTVITPAAPATTGTLRLPSVATTDTFAVLGKPNQNFTGPIGIGAANPNIALDVGGIGARIGSLTDMQAYFGLGGSANGVGGVILGAGTNGNTPSVAASLDGNAGPLPLVFYTYATARMVISGSGDVSMLTLATTSGGGGIYVCIDNNGKLYKKAACP
jgi:hypothetical protein